MKILFFIQKLKHLIYQNTNWSIPNDLQLNDLNGKVKSLSSKALILTKNKTDTSWANEILEDNNFEKIFNPFGFLLQETIENEDEQIKQISTLEYGSSIGFCEKEMINKRTNERTKSFNYKHLFSKNRITKWNITSTENLRLIEYLFDSSNNIKTINTYLNYVMPMTGEIKKKLLKSVNYNNKNKISSIVRENSVAEYLSTYFYVDEKLEKIEVNSEYSLNYKKVFLYDDSDYIRIITWFKDEKQMREDILINDKYGNWIEKNIEISNGWKIKVVRTINYYLN